MTTLLIDADIVAFRVAASSEDVRTEDYLANKLDDYLFDNIIHPLDNHLGETTKYQLFLTGRENFRKNLNPEYKANRKDKPKPKHLNWCKQYLLEHWNGIVESPYEADDLLGINQTEDTIICSIDKDLLTIPGAHYNFVDGNLIVVTDYEAYHWFCCQLLTGDRGDNVEGIRKINPKSLKISETQNFGLAGAQQWLAQCSTQKQLLERVKEAYERNSKSTEDITRTGQLLYIHRTYDDLEAGCWSFDRDYKYYGGGEAPV